MSHPPPCPLTGRLQKLHPRWESFLPRAIGCVILLFAPVLGRAVEDPVASAAETALSAPDWIRRAVVYEVNIRQYSDAGDFASVTADLPRLQELGVGVLWLMPIHPIGEKNRKGPLGSYYAVRDYLAVNPEFGTDEDFRKLVEGAHARGMRIILDWVANHTAWDNALATSHPEFYVRDAKGSYVPPTGFDWTDVIQLDFSNRAVWDYHVEAMSHWVKNFGVDGFRCDYAVGAPTAFWEHVSAKLRELRPDLLLLAEAELPQHQLRAFHASYGWKMMHAANSIAQGRAGVSHIDDVLAATRVLFPRGAVHFHFTSNHDENSWQGTEFERLGGGTAAFAVLSFVLDGIPLIYNGQEIALDRRLEFFERDPIDWREHPRTGFYRTLCELKRSHPALHTGAAMRRIDTTENDSVYAMLREAGSRRVVAFLNLTAQDVKAEAYDPMLAGPWRDAFTGEAVTLTASMPVELRSWGYRVLVSGP